MKKLSYGADVQWLIHVLIVLNSSYGRSYVITYQQTVSFYKVAIPLNSYKFFYLYI